MSASTVDSLADIARPKRTGFALSQKQAWGLLFVAPYMVIFAAFVVFPVGYAFWLARDPQLYVDLVHDPVFLRTAVNTLVFLIVAINVKMVIALFLSGFFTHQRLLGKKPEMNSAITIFTLIATIRNTSVFTTVRRKIGSCASST